MAGRLANPLDDRMAGHLAAEPARPRRQQVIKTHATKLKNSSGMPARRLQGTTL